MRLIFDRTHAREIEPSRKIWGSHWALSASEAWESRYIGVKQSNPHFLLGLRVMRSLT